jgi:CBS domain containing-hemolysin-like protein
VADLLAEWPRFVALAALLAGSAVFSGGETAFFSLPRSELDRLRRARGLVPRLSTRLLSAPRRLLVSILLGNLAVNTAYMSVAVVLAGRLSGPAAVPALSLGAVLFLVLAGEFVPKGLALHRPAWFAKVATPPIWAFAVACFPVRVVLDQVVRGLTRLFGGRVRSAPAVTAGELQAFVRLAGAAGKLDVAETERLADALELGEVRVSELMVPRVFVVSARIDDSREAFLALARKNEVSKIVAHRGSPDDVVGFVAVRDLLFSPGRTPADLLRPPRVVPETKSSEALLREFRGSRDELALVVDEYGGTAGILTVSDLLSHITGEEDEGVRLVAPGVFFLPGDMSLRAFEDLAARPLPPGRYDTVAGFVIAALGRMPRAGDSVRWGGWRLSVVRTTGGRIESLLMARPGAERGA